MAGGAYAALSGLRTRIEQLDRLAADIANVNTVGYKAERVTSVAAERSAFNQALQSAIDVAPGPGRLDLRDGALQPTGRDLDFAVDGRGFFVIDTPAGERYTRNGQFDRRADGTLVTADGMTVQGENGRVALGTGAIMVDQDGTLRADGLVAGKLKVVDFDDYTGFVREGGGRLRAPEGRSPVARTDVTVRGGTLEHSNVSVVERVAQLTEVSRNFEALQRGISILMNDIDSRAIAEFGRR
jgi:flagellar basal body rod protein FlgG